MSNGKIELNCRPLKIGFFVRPTSKNEIESAIQMNTFIWGGIYNPLLPKVSRIPKKWIEPHMSYSAKTLCLGYIDTFNPDLLISEEKETEPYEGKVNRANIHKDEFWNNSIDGQLPKVGIGLFEVAEHFCRSEMKYIRQKPYTFFFPEYTKKYSLFFDAFFGSLPKMQINQFCRYFDGVFRVEFKNCTIANFFEFLAPQNIFLRRIINYGIKVTRSNRDADIVFLLDAINPIDIFDFWNLRALGLRIVPIPIQSVKEPSIVKFAADFLKDCHYSYPYNAKIFHKATIQKSRSISKECLEEFKKQILEYIPHDIGANSKYFIREYYPRIWDVINYDDLRCEEFEYKNIKINLSKKADKITFTAPLLEVMRKYGNYGNPRYAIDIDYRFYATEMLYAETLPEINRSLARELGAFDVKGWRFSKGGLVYLCEQADWQVELNLPLAEHIFRQWLTENGWTSELSVPGKIGHQMIKYMEGIWGIGIFMNEIIIKMFSEMSEDRYKTASEVFCVAAKIVNEKSWRDDPEKYVERLIQCKALDLGVEAQCPICSQRSWFTITAFDYELVCPKCRSIFHPPFSKPKQLNWAYKAIGPFNLQKQAYGLFTVLLSLRFFSISCDFSTTPMLCFNAKKGNKIIEADLGLLFREKGFDEKRKSSMVLFAECKTFNRFEKKDIVRMKIIGDSFPGAFIVFATLRNNLEEGEINLIKSLANRGRKLLKSNRPRNPVIVLTGDQLFDTMWPPLSWKDKKELDISIHKKYSCRRIDDIFDLTQQLFLNMEPWSDYIRKQFEREIKKKNQGTMGKINVEHQTEEDPYCDTSQKI